MTPADFDVQFNRLTAHFHLPADANREALALDWLKAFEHYHVDALDHAITDVTRTAQDRFWPSLGKVLGIVRGRIAGMEKTGKCTTCHGSTWIDSAPFKSNGMIYENVVVRCPDCGVPAPQYAAPSHREPLTASEYAAWRRSEDQPQYMPEPCQARPHSEAPPELKAVFEKLRIKLFGTFVDNNGEIA